MGRDQMTIIGCTIERRDQENKCADYCPNGPPGSRSCKQYVNLVRGEFVEDTQECVTNLITQEDLDEFNKKEND